MNINIIKKSSLILMGHAKLYTLAVLPYVGFPEWHLSMRLSSHHLVSSQLECSELYKFLLWKTQRWKPHLASAWKYHLTATTRPHYSLKQYFVGKWATVPCLKLTLRSYEFSGDIFQFSLLSSLFSQITAQLTFFALSSNYSSAAVYSYVSLDRQTVYLPKQTNRYVRWVQREVKTQ